MDERRDLTTALKQSFIEQGIPRAPHEGPRLAEVIQKETAEPLETSNIDTAGNEPSKPARPKPRKPKPEKSTTEPSAPTANALTTAAVSITTRYKEKTAATLRRASLERKLAGFTPHSMQDIVEQAVSDWLASNGYR